MTTQSMTGMGQGKSSTNSLQISIEVKSVNHRFKDFRFKVPNKVSRLELDFRRKIEKHFKRGSFEVFLNYEVLKDEKNSFDFLDFKKIKNFMDLMQEGQMKVSADPTHFLRPEFYKTHKDDEELENSNLEMKDLSLHVLDIALKNLYHSRAEEGENLVKILKHHLEEFKKHFLIIQNLIPSIKTSIEEKIKGRFEEFQTNQNLAVDRPRFMQEIIYYLEKLDLSEELERITTHLKKVDFLLENNTSEIGRTLEFLLQELGRETNTIGSKSNSKDISENIVNMKVQLEKIREQALNLQ